MKNKTHFKRVVNLNIYLSIKEFIGYVANIFFEFVHKKRGGDRKKLQNKESLFLLLMFSSCPQWIGIWIWLWANEFIFRFVHGFSLRYDSLNSEQRTWFFTCTSEQFYEFHQLIYLLTIHTRFVCLQDYPDQFGEIIHPSLAWHLHLHRKIGCLEWNTGLNEVDLNEMHSNCYLIQ